MIRSTNSYRAGNKSEARKRFLVHLERIHPLCFHSRLFQQETLRSGGFENWSVVCGRRYDLSRSVKRSLLICRRSGCPAGRDNRQDARRSGSNNKSSLGQIRVSKFFVALSHQLQEANEQIISIAIARVLVGTQFGNARVFSAG